jgi:hypothetical protein
MMPSITEAEDFSRAPNHSQGISSVTRDRTESGSEVNTSSATVEVQNTAPAAPPSDNGEPEEDLGAFDDAHLQHDAGKKKKRKKKNKPKSKRGLVTHFSASS